MSFLLDTNILSELRKRRLANPKVRAWYSAVQNSELFTSVLVIGDSSRNRIEAANKSCVRGKAGTVAPVDPARFPE